MTSVSKSILKRNKWGLLELLLALYPILMGYSYGSVPFHLLSLIIMDVVALRVKIINHRINYTKLVLLLYLFIVFHEFILLLFGNSDSAFFHRQIEYFIIFVSIIIIYPRVDFEKLEFALILITIVSILGIVYHFVQLQSGGDVKPLKLPFFPDLGKDSRLNADIKRPCSFYAEPQSFCSFILVPLFIALIKRQWKWCSIIVLSMFLSTSTYGIVISLSMLTVFVLTQNFSLKSRLSFLILICALVAVLLSSSLFDKGIEKIENTDIETSQRLYNGPTLVFNMPIKDIIIGCPYTSPQDYCKAMTGRSVYLIPNDEGVYFIPSFWLVIAKWGLFGLFLYLLSYFYPMKGNRGIVVLGIPLFLGLFVNPDTVGSFYAFYIIIIYSFLNRSYNNRIKYENTNFNNPIRK